MGFGGGVVSWGYDGSGEGGRSADSASRAACASPGQRLAVPNRKMCSFLRVGPKFVSLCTAALFAAITRPNRIREVHVSDT